VRPIAVGDTLRRLVAKWLFASAPVQNAASEIAPLQTAFAKGGPCAVVAMGVQVVADTLHRSKGWLLFPVDRKNALNSIHRFAVLSALERRCPALVPWVLQAFQAAPFLVGSHQIWFTQGVQQGALSVRFFSLLGSKLWSKPFNQDMPDQTDRCRRSACTYSYVIRQSGARASSFGICRWPLPHASKWRQGRRSSGCQSMRICL